MDLAEIQTLSSSITCKIKFECDQPAGLRDIMVESVDAQTHGRRLKSDPISTPFKLSVQVGTPITKALTCMKIYLYKQKWQFAKETYTSGYFVV